MSTPKRALTTGQMAKLCRVNPRTLHYYDEIGLFSPNAKGENGYRYYALEQIMDLEVVLAFRELDMSLDEIKNALTGGAARVDEILGAKILEVDERIRGLQNVKSLLTARKELAGQCRAADKEAVEEVALERSLFALSAPISGVPDEDYYLALSALLEDEGRHRLYNHNYGIMIAMEKIDRGVFADYDYFFLAPDEARGRPLFERPAGRYLRCVCKGDWDTLPAAYRRILAYARAHDLTLRGYAYERGLNETLSTRREDYVTEILIECRAADKT